MPTGIYKRTPEHGRKVGERLRGRKYGPEVRKKVSDTKLGSKNPNWKGDKVGYLALHEWIKSHYLRPKNCQICGEEKQLDLANISQEYKRDVTDWEWLCRRCHMKKDGRLDNLIRRNRESKKSSI